MDGLCLKTGIPPAISVTGPLENRTNATQVSPVARSLLDNNKSTPPAAVVPSQKTAFSRLSCRYRLKSFWAGAGNGTRYNGMAVEDTVSLEDDNGGEEKVNEGNGTPEGQNGNWVMKILDVKSLWREKVGEPEEGNNENDTVNEEDEICEFCSVCDEDENEIKEIEINKHTFSKMLKRVSLTDAKLYAQMSYLGCLAYMIPKIKPESLLIYHGLRLVTSSKSTMKAEKNHDQIGASSKNQEAKRNKDDAGDNEQKNMGNRCISDCCLGCFLFAVPYKDHTSIQIVES